MERKLKLIMDKKNIKIAIVLIVAFFMLVLTFIFINLTNNIQKSKLNFVPTPFPTSTYEIQQDRSSYIFEYPTPALQRGATRWQTYENIQMSYKINYPTFRTENTDLENIICETGTESPRPFDLLALEKKGSIAASPCSQTDVTYRIELRSGPEEEIRAIELTHDKGAESKTESIIVDGVKGEKTTFAMRSPQPLAAEWIEVKLYKDGKGYQFILWDTTYESVFNTMLMTFKFEK